MTPILMILGMSLATMVPRWLPVWVVGRFNPPPGMKRWLASIPYAALGALIFPGVLTVEEGRPFVGLAGALAAALLAWFRLPILCVIGGAVVTVMAAKAWM